MSDELTAAIARAAVWQEKYINANERVHLLNQELGIIKSEYLEFLREKTQNKNQPSELYAVVFLDIKGFSKFSAAEKNKVLDLTRGLVPPLILANNAQQVNMWGDGIVALFSDVNDAIATSSKFLRHLSVEHLEARIGMAWGAVDIRYNPAIGRTDTGGLTVDRAARLESMAQPGEILLSSEFEGHDIGDKYGKLVKSKLKVSKAFHTYSVGDEIDVLRIQILMN